jgi:NitT/TauT family transport system substrate-binding protein
MILTGSGAKAMAAAVGGNVDVVMPSPAEVMKAREKDIDLVLFGAVSTELSTSIVFSKDWAARHNITESSSLEEKMAALKGARLAISSPGSLTDAVVRYFAGRGGLDPDRDMTLVAIPNQSSAMMIAMEQDRVDGFVIAPPDTVIAAHDLGAVIAFNLAAGAGKVPELAGFFHIGLAGTEEFVQSEKAEKVARAFQMTLDAINDPERTEIVRDRVHAAHYSNVDPEIFAEVWRNVVSAVPDTLRMDDGLFEKVLVLEEIVSADMDASMIAGSYTNELADTVLD